MTRSWSASAFAHSAQLAAPALAAYLLARLVGLVVLWLMAGHFDQHTVDLLAKSDGQWFLDIVRHGYDTRLAYKPNGHLIHTNIVFFPGYPFLVKGVATATGLSALHAGIATSWLAGLGAAWGIFAVGNHLYGRTTGTVLAFLWGIETHAIVESMVYSEGLFTALAAWCLYCVLRRRWLAAGVLCALAGATRAAALVLVAVVVLAAVIAIMRRRDGWRPWVGALVAPVGLAGYLAWVGDALGRWDGWFYMQAEGWKASFDGGQGTAHTFVHKVLLQVTWLEFYEVTAVVLGSVVLFVLLVGLRPPWPLVAYAAGLLVITIGSHGYYHARARFLLPAFPLLVPLGVALARAPRTALAAVLPSLALASAWYGGYLLLLWQASP